MARKPLSEKDLSALLEKAINDSEPYTDGTLAEERRKVGKYYRGEEPKPLHSGDSKYVSRDVFDTVDSMRSTVLESFMANTRIVKFQPEKGETVDDAKQATDFCRHVVFKDNDGEQLLYETLTDGLQNRFSLTKAYPEDIEEAEQYEFENLTPQELAMEVQQYDGEWELDEYEEDYTGLLSGTFTVTTRQQRIVTESVQPEDLLISSKSASLKDADYVIHRMERTRSELIKSYGKDAIKGVSFSEYSDYDLDMEKNERFEDVGYSGPDSAVDEASQKATVYEVYINLDMYKTGETSKWRLVYSDGVVIDQEQISRWPFASFVPIPRPHTYYGENFAESVIPIQNARTVLIRQIINHSLATNNPRHQVLSGTVHNPKELTDNRAGGIVNVKRMDGIAPLMQQPLNPYVFNLIQMIDEDKEEVTGVSKLSQGMNKDAISTQNAEGMVEQLISQSQQRQKIIARRFGKYLKDLFHLVYHIAVDHIDEAGFVDAIGSYVEVNPSEWQNRSAASIELTLGYGEQQKEAQKWVEIDQYIMNDPMLSHGYGYEKRYEVIKRGMEARGVEDLQAFLTPPEEYQPPEPSPAEQLEMAEAQERVAYQKAQTQAMNSKSQTQMLQAQNEQMKLRMEAAQFAAEHKLDVEKFLFDQQLSMAELAASKEADKSQAVYAVNG